MKTRKQTKKHIVIPEKHLGVVKTTIPNGYKLLKYKASCVAGNYYNLTTVLVMRFRLTTHCVLFDVTRTYKCERSTKQSDGVNN